jgi:hypothetical protein
MSEWDAEQLGDSPASEATLKEDVPAQPKAPRRCAEMGDGGTGTASRRREEVQPTAGGSGGP